MMRYIDETLAKGIVKRDLRNWKGNASELMKTLDVIAMGLNNFKTRDLREDAIFKKIKKNVFPFFSSLCSCNAFQYLWSFK
ncbi:hypothetical protein AB7Y06_18105 [Providencia rettgeri]